MRRRGCAYLAFSEELTSSRQLTCPNASGSVLLPCSGAVSPSLSLARKRMPLNLPHAHCSYVCREFCPCDPPSGHQLMTRRAPAGAPELGSAHVAPCTPTKHPLAHTTNRLRRVILYTAAVAPSCLQRGPPGRPSLSPHPLTSHGSLVGPRHAAARPPAPTTSSLLSAVRPCVPVPSHRFARAGGWHMRGCGTPARRELRRAATQHGQRPDRTEAACAEQDRPPRKQHTLTRDWKTQEMMLKVPAATCLRGACEAGASARRPLRAGVGLESLSHWWARVRIELFTL